MALVGRLFVILFAAIVASIAGGIITFGAVMIPEMSALEVGGFIDPQAIDIMIGFGFIFLSGFALLPVALMVILTEAFGIRSMLAYAVGGALVGAASYLGLVPFNTETMQFEGIIRRHLEVVAGAGIVSGLIYWLIAGRRAGVWRDSRTRATPPAATPANPPPAAP